MLCELKYIPDLWASGWTGQDIDIGIVELLPVQNISQINLIATQPVACDSTINDWHPTFVASVASSHVEPKGVAPDASILSSCADDEGTIWSALNWLFDNNADIANISLSVNYTPNRTNIDANVNAVARNRNKFITVGSGNPEYEEYVGSPGKAWNVLTVGGFEDNNTLKWSDDAMWTSSGYKNPNSLYNEHEKPEVVSVALVSSYNNTGVISTSVGTSNAAPQVAGLAALLMDRDENLKNAPLALRSIIMAGAIHNVRDIYYIPSKTGQDYWDGAGGIVGTATAAAATQYDPWPVCTYSCWWNIDIPYNSDNQNQVVFRERFYVDAGDRVRIVANWWAPEQPYHLNTVATDYDLVVRNPQGAIIATSNSADNNYEMVDFNPVLTDLSPNGHLFTIEIVQYDSVELNGNTLGIVSYRYNPTRSTFNETTNFLYLPRIAK